MITALITGIGGTNSIAILKALNASSVPHRSVGTDIKPLNAGSILADVAYLVPPVHDTEKYRESLEQIIKRERINIIFATTETEISYLSKIKDELEDKFGVVIMVPDSHILDVCQDKYKTQVFLQENGFVSIPTILAGDARRMREFVETEGLPLIRKPVCGYGSRGINIVHNQAELLELGYDDDYVLQKYIESDEDGEFDEYTAEIFVNQDGSIAGGIIIQRALVRGESNSGKIIKDENTLSYLKKVAERLKIKGPCNFQYRMLGGRAYIFEINARYSGTSAVRAHFGFNNVEMALRSFVQKEHTTIAPGQIAEGYFVRYWEEAYAKSDVIDELVKYRHIDNEK